MVVNNHRDLTGAVWTCELPWLTASCCAGTTSAVSKQPPPYSWSAKEKKKTYFLLWPLCCSINSVSVICCVSERRSVECRQLLVKAVTGHIVVLIPQTLSTTLSLVLAYIHLAFHQQYKVLPFFCVTFFSVFNWDKDHFLNFTLCG